MSYERIEQYYRENYNKLLKIFSKRCGGVENAEDVIQEGFYRALRYSDSLGKERDIEPWIRRILNNALRRYKKDHKMQGMAVPYHDDMHYSVDISEFDNRRLQEVENIINSKREDTRNVLSLYFFYNYKPKDIQKVTDMKNQAVRIAIWRFRKQMRG